MIIHSYESTARSDACVEYIRSLKKIQMMEQVFLLPIPSTRDYQTISGTNIYIYSILELLSPSCVLIGYSLPEWFLSAASDTGCIVHDVSLDEDFLLENATLTSEATLGILLNSSGKSVSNMRVGIVGYGRIGKSLTRMLLYLGASVKVYSSSDVKRLNLGEWGVATSGSTVGADLSDLDVLINTAPAAIFDTDNEAFSSGLRVIDLASGDNFPGLRSVEKYPSIPAKMFPSTAGVAWGRSIERFINSKLS